MDTKIKLGIKSPTERSEQFKNLMLDNAGVFMDAVKTDIENENSGKLKADKNITEYEEEPEILLSDKLLEPFDLI